MLIGLKMHLGRAVRGPHPGPLDLDASATKRDRTVLVAVAHRSPVGIVLALRANDVVDLLGHQLLQNAEPDTHAQRQKALLRSPHQLAQRFLHALRKHGLLHGRLSDRYVAPHGGSSFDLGRIAANAPNWSGRGRRDRRHFKVLRASGQPRQKRRSPCFLFFGALEAEVVRSVCGRGSRYGVDMQALRALGGIEEERRWDC